MDWSLLGEEQVRSVQWKITIYLVGRYLMVTGDTVFTACIHKHGSSHDICLKEYLRSLNRTVYMALGSEVYNDVRMLLFK